jgi:hypothetical protein
MAEKHQSEREEARLHREHMRGEHEHEHGEREAGRAAASTVRDGLIGGVHGAQQVAEEGVAMIRDVATDTLRAAGEVGYVAIDTTRGLLMGVADGLKDVVTHVVPWGARKGEPPKAEPRP